MMDSEAREERMVALYGQGMTVKEVAKEVGAGNLTVRRTLKLRGIALRGHRVSTRDTQHDETIITMCTAGATNREIAEAVGLKLSQVSYAIDCLQIETGRQIKLERRRKQQQQQQLEQWQLERQQQSTASRATRPRGRPAEDGRLTARTKRRIAEYYKHSGLRIDYLGGHITREEAIQRGVPGWVIDCWKGHRPRLTGER
jgi:transposase